MEAHASFGDLEGLGFGLVTIDEHGRVVSSLGSGAELLGRDLSGESAESLGLVPDAPLRAVDGRIIEVRPVEGSERSCWIVADVTARVEAERRMEEACWRLELALRKNELESFLGDAREVLARDGDVYSAAAALARVEAGAQALGLDDVAAAARAALDEGDLDAAACARVAESLDAFEAAHGAALSLGAPPPDPVATLGEVFRGMADRLERDVELVVEGEPGGALSPVLACVPPLLERAVLEGRVKAEPSSPAPAAVGKVQVRFGEEDGFSFLAVEDDGPGLDLEALEQRALATGALQPAQLESRRPHERLALAFLEGSLREVKAVADAARGHLEVRTGARRGTCFTVRVPVAS